MRSTIAFTSLARAAASSASTTSSAVATASSSSSPPPSPWLEMVPLARTRATTSPRGLRPPVIVGIVRREPPARASSRRAARPRRRRRRDSRSCRPGLPGGRVPESKGAASISSRSLAAGSLPLARHVIDELAIEAVDQLLQVLACRRGEARLGEAVGRALVFVALAALDTDAQPVQPGLEERRLDREAGHAKAAARLQPDLVERRGEIVVGQVGAAAAQRFGEADGELALAAEAGDRLAQLLHAGKACILIADLDIKAGDARIVGRLPQTARPSR